MSKIVSTDLRIKRAESSDINALNPLIDNSGGATLLKATFGPYNFHSIIETTFLTMIAAEVTTYGDSSQVENSVGFLSINDSFSLSAEGDSLSIVIDFLNAYIPVTVRQSYYADYKYRSCKEYIYLY
jgi:hypothetical protein